MKRHRVGGRRKKLWIQGAIGRGKRGALHRMLGIPEGENIPLKLLRKASKKGGKLGHRARLALTLRKLPRHHGPRR